MTADAIEISDEELTALALAADPDAACRRRRGAVRRRRRRAPIGLLPAWYMPRPRQRAGRSRRVVFAVFIGALIVVNGAGLCVTYGLPEIPL